MKPPSCNSITAGDRDWNGTPLLAVDFHCHCELPDDPDPIAITTVSQALASVTAHRAKSWWKKKTVWLG